MSPPASVNHVGTRDGWPISKTAEATTTAAAPTSKPQSAGFERLLPPRSDIAPPSDDRAPGRRASDRERESARPCDGHESTAGGAGRGCRIVATVPMTQTADATTRAARRTNPPTDVPPKCTTRISAGTAQDSQRTAERPQPTDEPRNVGRCSRSRPRSRDFFSSSMVTPSCSLPLPPYVEVMWRSRAWIVRPDDQRGDKERVSGLCCW